MIKVIALPVSGPATLVEIDPNDPAPVQALVEGYFEVVRLHDASILFVNEEGRLRRMIPNERASILAQRPIVGPVVLAGPEFIEGEPSDAPAFYLDMLGV